MKRNHLHQKEGKQKRKSRGMWITSRDGQQNDGDKRKVDEEMMPERDDQPANKVRRKTQTVMDRYIIPGNRAEGEDEAVGMGGPCHLYGGVAPPQQINTRACGQSSQENDQEQAEQLYEGRSQAEPWCQAEKVKNTSRAEQHSKAGEDRGQ